MYQSAADFQRFLHFLLFLVLTKLKLSQAQRLTPRQRSSELRLLVSEGLMAQRFVCTPACCSMKLSMDMHGATVCGNDSSMRADSNMVVQSYLVAAREAC